MPRASRLGDEIKNELGADVELLPGNGGVYTITADGRLIFSKKQEGHFPAPEEIINKLRQVRE